MIEIGDEILYKKNACIFTVKDRNEYGTFFTIENEFELYHDVPIIDIELI